MPLCEQDLTYLGIKVCTVLNKDLQQAISQYTDGAITELEFIAYVQTIAEKFGL